MANAKLATRDARGIKRTCGACELRFYDLARPKINCPNCGEAFTPPAVVDNPQPPPKAQNGGFSAGWPQRQRPLPVEDRPQENDKTLLSTDPDVADQDAETQEPTETDANILDLDDDD